MRRTSTTYPRADFMVCCAGLANHPCAPCAVLFAGSAQGPRRPPPGPFMCFPLSSAQCGSMYDVCMWGAAASRHRRFRQLRGIVLLPPPLSSPLCLCSSCFHDASPPSPGSVSKVWEYIYVKVGRCQPHTPHRLSQFASCLTPPKGVWGDARALAYSLNYERGPLIVMTDPPDHQDGELVAPNSIPTHHTPCQQAYCIWAILLFTA